MDKELIKILIAEYQQKISRIYFQRREYTLEDNLNYVFVGLRRVGKSYLQYQQIRHLLEIGHSVDEILYFNFEDDRIPQLSVADLDLIKTCYEEMYDSQPIFFFDEIQIVDNWHKFARRLADNGFRVYITGSNAKMLSSEIATTLGGRYVIKNVYSYSFQEFLMAKGVNVLDKNFLYKDKNKISKFYLEYFKFGALPEIVGVADKREWLSSLYRKIFFGDMIARYQIRNDFALRVLIRKLAESVMQPSSFNRLANSVSSSGKKVSTDTVIDYLGYLKDSWMIFSIENICSKLADKESIKKYYFIDNGLLNLFLLEASASLLENLTAIQLIRLYGNDNVFYYNHNIEVDFYVPNEKLAIQVCYNITDEETQKREVSALLKMSQRIDVKKMIIITQNMETTIVEKDTTIDVVPMWKWLLTK